MPSAANGSTGSEPEQPKQDEGWMGCNGAGEYGQRIIRAKAGWPIHFEPDEFFRRLSRPPHQLGDEFRIVRVGHVVIGIKALGQTIVGAPSHPFWFRR
jgi:hypothetical protein